MRRSERVESPGTYVTERVGPVFFRTALLCSGSYHLERGGMQLHDAVGINCKNGATTENQGAGVNKVNGLKKVYSPKLLEPTSPRCQVIELVIMSRCMNFTVFSFLMVSNNKKVCTISVYYVVSIV